MSEDRAATVMTAISALQKQVEEILPKPELPPDPVTEQLNALTETVAQLSVHVAERESDQVITGLTQPPRLTGGRTSLDQIKLAAEALFAGVRAPSGIPPLSGLRELYLALSGDWEMAGLFHPERVTLANVDSATMAQICADAMNKKLMFAYAEYPKWWQPIVLEEDFTNLHNAKWMMLGGLGELPTVAEGAAYTELEWVDQEQQDAFIKKGGYLGITIEAIDKDDVGALRAAPAALAQAAWLTLSKAIANLFTANAGLGQTLDDATTLFTALKGNLGSSALSWAAWVATRTLMRQMPDVGSGERLGALTAGYYLLVPSDLEIVALQTIGSANEPGVADNDLNPVPETSGEAAQRAEARKRVIVVDLWTDAEDWVAVCKPELYPTIGLGYRFGRVPEIFSVASPTAGLMFTNDTMPIKVRFFYATGAIDYRGMYKHKS